MCWGWRFVSERGRRSARRSQPAAAAAHAAKPPATIASKTAALKKLDGFMPLYWDEKEGKLLMEIGQFDTELLYQVSLPAGVGSNPIGLDRGALGDTHVVTFQRVGPKVLMVEPNYRYRAITSDPAELRAVQRLVRAVGAVGLHRRSQRRLARAGRRDEAVPARCLRRDRHAARHAPGAVSPRRVTQRLLSGAHEELPEELRDRSDADVRHRRSARPARAPGDADAAGRDGAAASLVHRAAEARCERLQAPQARSARRRLRHRIPRLRVADHRSDREALDRRVTASKRKTRRRPCRKR